MRSRRSAHEEVAEVARRRLELLSAELAELRPGRDEPPSPAGRGGLGEPPPPGPGPSPGPVRDPVPDRWPDPWPDPAPEHGPAPAPDPPAAEPPVPELPVPGRHALRPVGPLAALAGWVGDRIPATLQGRVRMSAGHLVVVLVVAVIGLAATAWQVTRAGHGSPAPPAAVPAPSPLLPVGSPGPTEGPPTAAATDAGPSPPGASGPASGAPGASGSATGGVVVDVTGKVRRPGIATLPPGSRVADALKAAGGAKRGVALTSLNLARVLSDGEQIVVGVEAPSGVAASAASVPSAPSSGGPVPMVNVNTAGQAELEQLPGIGPVTALAILDFRSQQGRFTSVEQLLEVSGIGDATLAKIAPYVTL